MTTTASLTGVVLRTMSRNRHLGFLKLDDAAVIPMRATSDSVGYDLSSKDNGVSQTVPAHGQALIQTGLRIFIPGGCYGRISERSSMSWKNHTSIGAGVIDPGYKGEVGVVLRNHGDTDLEIIPGQRIAQLIVEYCKKTPVYEVKSDPQTGRFVFERVGDRTSVRGEGGFGSTGERRLLRDDEQQSRRQQEPPKKFPSPNPPPEKPEKYDEKDIDSDMGGGSLGSAGKQQQWRESPNKKKSLPPSPEESPNKKKSPPPPPLSPPLEEREMRDKKEEKGEDDGYNTD